MRSKNNEQDDELYSVFTNNLIADFDYFLKNGNSGFYNEKDVHFPNFTDFDCLYCY
jgi:hypothetical protein